MLSLITSARHSSAPCGLVTITCILLIIHTQIPVNQVRVVARQHLVPLDSTVYQQPTKEVSSGKWDTSEIFVL